MLEAPRVAGAVTDLPPAGYAAGVPLPALGFSIDVPDRWTVLDLNPDTWDGSLDAFLDQRLSGRPTAAQERARPGPPCWTCSAVCMTTRCSWRDGCRLPPGQSVGPRVQRLLGWAGRMDLDRLRRRRDSATPPGLDMPGCTDAGAVGRGGFGGVYRAQQEQGYSPTRSCWPTPSWP
ncbi:MAG: hypothetical protein M3450_10300 [Actinomycetota bacterium]|nr:hypothetical protein [Actinomycetota bacterium]